jgi:hypothetical protein
MTEKADKDVMAATAAVEKGGSVDETTAALKEMGYKQELKRNLGMVSVLGLSFAIMAVPYGSSTTLNIALTDGGPVTILWGVSDRQRRSVGRADPFSVGLCILRIHVYRFQSG